MSIVDKEEFRIKLEEINHLVEQKDYKGAMEVVDSIDWRRVKNVRTLCVVGEIYAANKRYEESRDIFLLAYHRASIGKNILYRLIEISLKMGDIDEATEYYEEFCSVAPNDNTAFVLKYKILREKNAPLEEQISVLEQYKEREFTEKWSYELANLYYRAGKKDKCNELCNEMILWFNEGTYIDKALNLKYKMGTLTEKEAEKYRASIQEDVIVLPDLEEGDTEKEEESQEQTESEEYSEEEAELTDPDSIPIESISVKNEKDLEGTETLQERISKGIRDLFGVKKKASSDLEEEEEEMEEQTEAGEEIQASERSYDNVPALEKENETSSEETEEEDDAFDNSESDEKESISEKSDTKNLPDIKSVRKSKAVTETEEENPQEENSEEDSEEEDIDEEDEFFGEENEEHDNSHKGLKLLGLSLAMRFMKKKNPDKEKAKRNPEDDYIEEEDLLNDDFSGEDISEDESYESEEEQIEEEINDPAEDIEEEETEESTEENKKDENQNFNLEDTILAAAFAQGIEIPDENSRRKTDSKIKAAEKEIIEETPEETEEKKEILTIEEQVESEVNSAPEVNESVENIPDLDPDDIKIEESEESTDSTEEKDTEEPEADDSMEEEDPEEKINQILEETSGEQIQEEVETPEQEEAEEEEEEKPVLSEEEELERFIDSINPKEDEDPDSIIPRERELREEEIKLFSYFVKVPGMKEQLIDTLCNVQEEASDKTSCTGNIIVMGGNETGKTRLISGLIPAICKQLNLEASKVAYVFAEQINGRDINNIVDRLAGGFLVIEKANQLDQETAVKLNVAMEKDTDGLIVILEDNKIGMRKLMARYEKLARKFTSIINIPVFTNDELANFARIYAKENGYRIDNMGMLAVYNLIGENQKQDVPMNIGAVKEMVDNAITKAQGIGLFKKSSLKKRTDKDGYILLYEKDFNGK